MMNLLTVLKVFRRMRVDDFKQAFMSTNLKGMRLMRTQTLTKYGMKYLLPILALFAMGASAQAATKFLIILPGHSYNGSTAPNRTSPTNQVAGEPFTLKVHCYDDSSNLPVTSSFATTSLSSTASYTFNPSGAFDLPETFSSVARSLRGTSNTITGTLTPASKGTYQVSVASSGGIGADSTSVYVQRIDHYTFTINGGSAYTAGTAGTLVIQAVDDTGTLCDGFNGQATLTAYDADVNGGALSLGTITFTNGVYTNNSITFYHATQFGRFQVTKSNSPAAVNPYSGNFTINPASFSKLLILGPGQTIRTGDNGGSANGRTGQSTTTSSQTVGSNFSLAVYACDSYWNTLTANTTVTLSSSDPAFSNQSQGFGGGSSVQFSSVNLHTVGAGSAVMTASDGSHTNSTDTVPLTAATLDHFTISSIPNPSLVTANISVTVRGFDVYGNTVSSISGTTSAQVWYGSGSYQLSSANSGWSLSPNFNSANFTNGTYTGTLNIRRADANYNLRVVNSVVGNTDSNSFNMTAGAANKYIVVMPGQTYTPGERFSGNWGRSGSASARTAGAPFNVSVIATDAYGNRVDYTDNLSWSNVTHLANADGSASVSPNPIAISAGAAYPSFTLTLASTTQVLTVPRNALSGATLDSGMFTIVNTTLHHFAINASASQTAGNQFSAQIIAQDQYNNAVTGHSGTVYLTCPDLDYFGPTESVIQVTGGTKNYNSASTTANWSTSGFVNGVLTTTMRVYRATTGSNTAILYVSDVAADKPTSHTGHVGQSVALTISPNSYKSMFCIVPGLTYRPGADAGGNTYFAGVGYTGSPLSQQLGAACSVTVYATDLYWNLYTSGNDQFTPTSNPTSSVCNGQAYNTPFSLVSGLKQLDVVFNAAANYTLTFTNPSPGISPYTTPYQIVSFSIYSLQVEKQGGGNVPGIWVAGVPVNVQITAYEDDQNHVATTFNGTAALHSSLDHSPTLQCIRPTTITFTSGVWTGQVTIFRRNKIPTGTENNNFRVEVGNVQGQSSSFEVTHNTPTKLLITESGGMTEYPGLNPDVWPDFTGADGQPGIQTAGIPITKISFYLCDDYWNTVTNTAQGANGQITIQCSDPYPATLNGTPFVSGQLNVNLVSGKYDALNTFVLYKVNGTDGQSIRVTKATGETPFELGVNKNKVPVKHRAIADSGFTGSFQFQLFAPVVASGATAGVPFPITVAAVDNYGNTLDSINGAAAFGTYNTVNLSAQTDTAGYSIWPLALGNLESTKWIEGISRPWLYVFKKVSGSENLTATYDFGHGTRQGTSQFFSVKPNAYARLIPVVSGMKTPDDAGAGGIYTATYASTPPPAQASVFNNMGSPIAQTAGIVTTVYAYSCDIYGNVVKYTTDTVNLSNSDRFAPNPGNTALDTSNGYAQFTTFKFHSRGIQTITASDVTVNTITAGTTPNVTVNPGAFFGLQVISPGQVAVEGSGNTNASISGVPPHGWFSGVTLTDPGAALSNVYQGRAQLAGIYFGITVQAVDIYGNYVGSSPTDTIELTTDAGQPTSIPWISGPISADLDASGKTYFNCRFSNGDTGTKQLRPTDLTNTTIVGYGNTNPPTVTTSGNSYSLIQVAQATETKFKVIVNGVKPEESVPVYVDAWPDTFTVQVQVQYTGTGEIVSVAQSFVIEPTLNQQSPPTMAQGTLGIQTGVTSFGISNISAQTYSRAENIFLRVRDASGTTYPLVGFSPEIRVRASSPSLVHMWADTVSFVQGAETNYQIEANKNARVYAQVFDANNNPVTGRTVSLDIISPTASVSTLGAPESLTSDSSGTVYRTFYAGAQNVKHVIQATAGNTTGQLNLFVTVTSNGGVYPNPFNPARGQLAHIDYPLDKNSAVKVNIYTLLGDLVYHKEYASGNSEGGHAGVNSITWDGRNDVGNVVANGGYICVIKANDTEKFRFKLGVFKEK